MANSDDDVPVDDLDMQEMIAKYLEAFATGNDRECLILRNRWEAWRGEDDLHETAIGLQD